MAVFGRGASHGPGEFDHDPRPPARRWPAALVALRSAYSSRHPSMLNRLPRSPWSTRGREPMATGPFQPTWESLQRYQVPEWFRDAKFGIWAHWGPQCQPERGDWYARQHVRRGPRGNTRTTSRTTAIRPSSASRTSSTPGRPRGGIPRRPSRSTSGPARSTSSRWPTTTTTSTSGTASISRGTPCASGRRRTSIAGWAGRRAPQRPALRRQRPRRRTPGCGMSRRRARTGRARKAGVPYDGKLTKADGKGTWWEGLDPQDLYEQRHQSTYRVPGPRHRLAAGAGAAASSRPTRPTARTLLQPHGRPHQPLPARPALLRRHRAAALARQRRRPEDRRALLQQQHRGARRDARSRAHRQGARGRAAASHGVGHRARREQRARAAALADRHLHRRLALRPARLRAQRLQVARRPSCRCWPTSSARTATSC